jgi:beta-glucosidase
LGDYLFPNNFPHIFQYIYPYVNSINATEASADPNYGQTADQFLPPHAVDGSPQPLLAAGGGPGGNPELWDVLYTVKATIKNTGALNGEEVPQLYVSLGGPNDPKIILRGFDRLSIDVGQSATFSTDILRRDLSNWDTFAQNWVITSYPKTVYVGPSSRNLPLSQILGN